MTKHTLYVIGGPPRSGKTIIAHRLMRRKPLVLISTDATRSIIRSVFLGEGRVSVDRLSFRGTARFRRPGSLKTHQVSFAKVVRDEDALAWQGIKGAIQGYDRINKIDLLVEGIAVTPERLARLKLKNLVLSPVFMGYSDVSHADSVLAYSKKNRDWVYTWLKERKGDDSHVRAWVQKKVAYSRKIKKNAERLGYKYFDVTARPFEKHIQVVSNYLLKR